tara:strand:- start:1417 stop:1653 length:237 start_codon:yes stop_codon:yes gene_type:complete
MSDKRWFTDHTRPDVWNKFAPGWVDKLQSKPPCVCPEKWIVAILDEVFEAGFVEGDENGTREHTSMHDEYLNQERCIR